MRTVIEDLINQLNDVQEARNWMGSSFKQKLDVIDSDKAFIRPLPDLHSVAEIISHLTVWRKDAVLKINTGKGSLTEASEENWNKVKADYQDSLAEIIDLLRDKDDAFLQQQYFDTDFKSLYPFRYLIHGMLHHDIYHLGQLGIIIKYLKRAADKR